MTFPRTKRFIVALLAQVTLCLAFAPVIASGAQPPRQESSQNDKPTPGGSIQAFDAANVRPEEVSDAERKPSTARGKSKFRTQRRFGIELKDVFRDMGVPPIPDAPGVGKPSLDNSPLKVERRSHGRDARVTGSDSQPTADDALAQRKSASQNYPIQPSSIIGNCIQPTGPPALL